MKLAFPSALLAVALVVGACSGTASAAARTNGPAGARVFIEYIAAPAQFDLSLAEISFRTPAGSATAGTGSRSHSAALRLALRGTAGLNYVAGALVRSSASRRVRVLVLVVNRRPRGSLAPDLARIGLNVTAARRLGAPRRALLANPFSHPTIGLTPALCDVPIRGPSLTAADLRAVLSRGSGLGGFGPAAAIAQAYDAVCARPYSPAFRQAVTIGASSGCDASPAGVVCCPLNAICAPPPPAPPPPAPQPPPPCPSCPCPGAPCPLAVAPGAATAIACGAPSQTIVCPL